MGSVTGIVRICPSNPVRVRDKVVAMFSGLRISPHIGGKVRMAVSHALIHDRHDDRRVAGSKFPRVHDIDISPCHGIPHRIPIAGIMITPLLRKHRVIERGI